MTTVAFEINGENVIVNDVDPHCTLLQWLRASGRTGSKEGCAEGECGACAVAFVQRGADGHVCYEAVNSCLVSLAEAHGRAIISVEGVSEGLRVARREPIRLHPVQESMVALGGSQCGYCTPGFVMSLFCEYYRPGRSGYDPDAISGNLCRCTGYRPIADVARSLPAPSPGDPFLERLRAPSPSLPEPSMGSDGAVFVRPRSLEEVVHVLSERPEAVVLAGGTDLFVYANQRGLRFPALVSLGAVPELQGFACTAAELVLGAGLSLSHVERLLAASPIAAGATALRELLPLFASRLIRNRATLGGNLATASPIGDAAPVLLALGAELRLASVRGERRLPLSEFFLGYRRTALAPGEVIVSVHIPLPLPRVGRFYKVSKRVMDDISTVAAAFTLELAPDGVVRRFTAAYGGVAATPLAVPSLAELARGQPWAPATLDRLVAAVRELGSPLTDHRGSAAYRRAMLGKLLQRFYVDVSASKGAPISTSGSSAGARA